jgi:hypothetical protein
MRRQLGAPYRIGFFCLSSVGIETSAFYLITFGANLASGFERLWQHNGRVCFVSGCRGLPMKRCLPKADTEMILFEFVFYPSEYTQPRKLACVNLVVYMHQALYSQALHKMRIWSVSHAEVQPESFAVLTNILFLSYEIYGVTRTKTALGSQWSYESIPFTGPVHAKLGTVVVCKQGLTVDSKKNVGAFIGCRREDMPSPHSLNGLAEHFARSKYSILRSTPGSYLSPFRLSSARPYRCLEAIVLEWSPRKLVQMATLFDLLLFRISVRTHIPDWWFSWFSSEQTFRCREDIF